MSAGSDSTHSSPSGDLPSASYDGSHLPWRTFRQEVLAPHRIRVLESPPKERIPTSFLKVVEAASQDTARFEDQKMSFWNQVTAGRGFGPSPLFPPNLLPPIEAEPRLSRCMVPSFSREALPERAINQMGPLYELSVPHPGLGCGFSAAAFTNKELASLPQWLQASGTIVHFDTGYISAGATMYCSFLTFERAYGNKEHRVESANNQCAIAGAFSARALQMLYTKAWKGQMMPELPVAFSCTIDNSFALLNLHWIDHGQAYCMAPLCQFDLSKDIHFNKFLVWTQAIGDWALSHVLPLVKQALERLQTSHVIASSPQAPDQPTKLRLDTGVNKDELLISSLKTTFENIPWRFEDDEFTPVSSSTASWGSPMVSDLVFSNLSYPPVRPPRSNSHISGVARKHVERIDTKPVTPPPDYLQNQDMVSQKRFNHAMDEIRELQQQIQALKAEVVTSQSSLRDELTMIKSNSSSSEPTTPRVSKSSTHPPAVTSFPVSSIAISICTTIILSGHILTTSIPGITVRMIALGCITNACIWTFISPRFSQVSPRAKISLPSLWRP
ncbi:uncharacterized protein Z518_00030 [Rhinocladiella mackenziei CBS 650.93]|uniref:DUF7924 domain-containing protein n=1 Tax=Rhinocladiella mackenziei CBS 650.93 TaxID=1442369 RepID=A0A0D2G335_9EURO|nr:uncharacterized protein Z518_00030 [Rhinocladiella mackenziei CBS 650.93]KIX08952.1 hypothetical protein Z518_00030 [Rhinocladiella mackenziei CBS 650.93]